MKNISVQGYTMEYPPMNLNLFKTNRKKYDMCMLIVHIKGINKGFKVKRMNKVTKKGTKITFVAIKNKDELEQYSIKIQNLMDKFNKNYGTSYTL